MSSGLLHVFDGLGVGDDAGAVGLLEGLAGLVDGVLLDVPPGRDDVDDGPGAGRLLSPPPLDGRGVADREVDADACGFGFLPGVALPTAVGAPGLAGGI
jgi:hypothetical protein